MCVNVLTHVTTLISNLTIFLNLFGVVKLAFVVWTDFKPVFFTENAWERDTERIAAVELNWKFAEWKQGRGFNTSLLTPIYANPLVFPAKLPTLHN